MTGLVHTTYVYRLIRDQRREKPKERGLVDACLSRRKFSRSFPVPSARLEVSGLRQSAALCGRRDGRSAPFSTQFSMGSNFSQNTHLSSVWPLSAVIGTILVPQFRQRTTRSIAGLSTSMTTPKQ